MEEGTPGPVMPLALRALRTGACARFPHSWRQPCTASAQEVAGRDKRQAHVCTPRFQGGAGCCGNPGCTPKAAPAALPSRGALVGTTSDRRKKHWAQACQDQSTQQTHQECESMLSGHHSFRHQAVFLRLSQEDGVPRPWWGLPRCPAAALNMGNL